MGRRRFSREFKVEAVKQVVEEGRTVSEVAGGLGIHPTLLSRWKVQLIIEGVFAIPDNEKEDDAEVEIRRLKKELAIARQERDILKKAAAYFAREQS